jgi:hypothetical protein
MRRRRGRSRKQGLRERNGRLKRPDARAEKAAALDQPHRRRFGDDFLAESPLGRLVLANRLRRELHEAGLSYSRLWRRARAHICAPVPRPRPMLALLSPGCVAPRDFSEAEIRQTRHQLAAARKCLNGSSEIVDRLAVQEVEIAEFEAGAAIEGLTALAVDMGLLAPGEPPDFSVSTKFELPQEKENTARTADRLENNRWSRASRRSR